MASASLQADDQRIETIFSPEYWRALCPHLSVSDAGVGRAAVASHQELAGCASPASLRNDLVTSGFFLADFPEGSPVRCLAPALARGVELLLECGWPASFIFVFDEAWMVIKYMAAGLAEATGGSCFLGDIYAWHVDPAKGQQGWGPHRDRMGSDASSFRADGTPRLSTTWLALSDATPQNSCMHVVPAYADPNYSIGDTPGVDALSSIFADPTAFQHIRSVPRPAGTALHFSHRVIHWGSSARTREPPRIAMSWVVGDPEYETPALQQPTLLCTDGAAFVPPNVRLRIALVCAQLISYSGQTGMRSGRKSLFMRIFKQERRNFGLDYVDKVEYLFHMRPPPQRNVQLRKRKVSTPKGLDELEFYTAEDDAKVEGMKGLFADSSSSEGECDD